MISDDLENSKSEVEVTTSDSVETVEGVSTETVFINLWGEVDKVCWDEALNNADNALVLIQWLESKRADKGDLDD